MHPKGDGRHKRRGRIDNQEQSPVAYGQTNLWQQQPHQRVDDRTETYRTGNRDKGSRYGEKVGYP